MELQEPPPRTLEAIERAAVEDALKRHQGNRTHAARELGIAIRTLQRMLVRWDNGQSAQRVNHAS